MVPPAPPRLSITILCPSASASLFPTERPTRSVPPPGGNGTIIRIGRLGHASGFWASVTLLAVCIKTAAVPSSRTLASLDVIILNLTVWGGGRLPQRPVRLYVKRCAALTAPRV